MEYELISPRNPNYSILEQVFINRGFKYEDIEHYLFTTEDDLLNPELITNIREGAEMLVKNIRSHAKTALIVDSDCDGFTSSAILLNYLNRIFPSFAQTVEIIVHPGKEHGIILDELPNDVQFVIAPDSSSNDYEQHKILKDKNIDVLVIDHHEAEKISENACIINNQLCNYPNKTLSGAGMVFKFCCYIDDLLGAEEARDFVDLATLGIIADVMLLTEFETKRIIDLGIANIKNPFIQKMVERNSFSLGDELTPTGIAFYIAPYVNAAIRIGEPNEKRILFNSMLEFKADELIPSTKRGCAGQLETTVDQACRTCANIKNRQTKERDKNCEIIKEIIEENHLDELKVLTIQLPSAYACNRNLTGLIANVLMGEYERPVLLLNQTEVNGEVWWEGSGRGCNKSKLQDFKDFLYRCGLDAYEGYAQGHQQAFGFGIKDKYFKEFFTKVENELEDFSFSPSYKVDFIFGSRDYDPSILLELGGSQSIWGQGIEEPKIAFESIAVTSSNTTLMSPDKNPTIKITMPSGVSCIKFKSSQEEFDKLVPREGCNIINIVGRCENNEWNGNIKPQIIIEDYEIISSQKYYF